MFDDPDVLVPLSPAASYTFSTWLQTLKKHTAALHGVLELLSVQVLLPY